MFACPIAGGRFVFCCVAVHAGSKVFAAFRVFVLPKVLVISVSVGHFFNFVPLLGEHYKFFLRPRGGLFRFIKPSKNFPSKFNFTGG